MSQHLQKELSDLRTKILEIGTHVEHNLYNALQSVDRLDGSLFDSILNEDNVIDQLEVDLEEDCLKLLALYQPVAGDLRFVVSVLKINNDLERIGDLAVNIGRLAYFLSQEEPVKVPFNFEEMSSLVIQMVKRALDSLVNMDGELAKAVCRDDDLVDDIHRKMYSKVYQKISEAPSRAKSFIHYLSVSRHLERIADYSTNIAEDVIYMIDGVIVRHQHKSLDNLS